MKHKVHIFTTGGLALALVVLVGVNLLSNTLISKARVDLTEQGLYTLSDGSRNLLESLDEPVTLRYFLSRDLATRLPGINAYARRVEELLEEFARVAGGNIDLRIVEPEPFSEAEDRALAYGLEGVPLGDGEGVLYFGLVASGPTNEEEVIPFFSTARENFLEYDLARMIHQVGTAKSPVVGLLSTLPMDGAPAGAGFMGAALPRPWTMLEQVEQFFEVRTIAPDSTSIPADVDVLMVVHPATLDDAALYAIDQYVLGGGHAVMFVDPHAEADRAGMLGAMSARDGYAHDKLLERWGLRLRPGAVAADVNLAQRVRTRSEGRNVVIDYPVWLNLRPSQYDDGDVVTAELGDVVMASAGILEVIEQEGIEVTPLIRTTEAATGVDPVRIGPGADVTELIRGYQGGGERLMLAARVMGTVTTAFPDGPPPGDDPGDGAAQPDDARDVTESPERPAHLAQSAGPVNLIVIADTDLLRDEFWVTRQNLFGTSLLIPTAANSTLVINSLENLAGDENLISIRGRGGYSRPFTLLDDVRRDAELRFLQKEQELLDELRTTEQRLADLQQQQTQADGLILSDEQRLELERFREQKVRIRRELRDVRRNLREDIESIQAWVRFANIALVPILIGIGGVAFAASRHAGRRASDA